MYYVHKQIETNTNKVIMTKLYGVSCCSIVCVIICAVSCCVGFTVMMMMMMMSCRYQYCMLGGINNVSSDGTHPNDNNTTTSSSSLTNAVAVAVAS